MPEQELSTDISKRIVQLDRELKGIVSEEKKRGKIISVVAPILTASFKSHIGPLPSPETLKQYDELLPGTAERIISMAERQNIHRIDLENKVITRQLQDSRVGQFMGFLIAVLFAAVAYSLGMNGHDTLAGVLGGSTLVSLVAIFVVGKKKQGQDLQAKA